MQSMVDFFDEGDERVDISIAQTGTRIVYLELFDKPARIVNSNTQATVGSAKKGSGEHAQLGGLRSSKG